MSTENNKSLDQIIEDTDLTTEELAAMVAEDVLGSEIRPTNKQVRLIEALLDRVLYRLHPSLPRQKAVERVLENENEMISMTPTSNVSLSVGDTLTVSNQIHATDTFTFNTGLGKGFKTAGWSYSENDDKK